MTFNCAWKDKSIYEKAKGCFFIQATQYEDEHGQPKYNVYVDSLWKDKWQPVMDMSVLCNIDGKNVFVPIGKIKDIGNPKEYLGLSKKEFDKTFEKIQS